MGLKLMAILKLRRKTKKKKRLLKSQVVNKMTNQRVLSRKINSWSCKRVWKRSVMGSNAKS